MSSCHFCKNWFWRIKSNYKENCFCKPSIWTTSLFKPFPFLLRIVPLAIHGNLVPFLFLQRIRLFLLFGNKEAGKFKDLLAGQCSFCKRKSAFSSIFKMPGSVAFLGDGLNQAPATMESESAKIFLPTYDQTWQRTLQDVKKHPASCHRQRWWYFFFTLLQS